MRPTGAPVGRLTTVLFVVGAVLGGLLVGALLGGSLQRLEQLRLRDVRWLGVAVVVQTGASLFLRGGAYATGLAASVLFALAFVARNRQLAGRGLLVGGLALNAAVIIVNSAMPVRASAADRAGVSVHTLVHDPRHTLETRHTRLAALDDRIPLPLPVGAQVLSIGDVLVAAGAGLLITQAMRRRVAPPAPIVVSPPPVPVGQP
jgi:hypothetical protein